MSETTKTKRTQTRNPRAALSESRLDRENFHYLKVQVSEPGGYQSPLADYLDMESPTRPGEPLYTIEADPRDARGEEAFTARQLAGGKDMVLLKCSKEDYEALLKANADEAYARERKVAPKQKRNFGGYEGEEFEEAKGGVLAAS